MKLSRRLFLSSALILIAACMYSRAPQSSTQGPAILKVDNQGILDMTIYALRGTERVRLGIASGGSATRFPLPANLVVGSTTLRFLADPIGSNRTPVSDEITILQGDEVTWTIPPQP